MLKAVKANKEYSINEDMKQRYLDDGYDICDDKGKIIEHSPKKKIDYSEYAKLKEKNRALKKQLAELQKKASKKSGKDSGEKETTDNKADE